MYHISATAANVIKPAICGGMNVMRCSSWSYITVSVCGGRVLRLDDKDVLKRIYGEH
jgi:hypothetical protein